MHKHLNITDIKREGNTPGPSCFSPFEPQNVYLELSLLCTLFISGHTEIQPWSLPEALYSTVEKQNPLGPTVHLIYF